MTPGGAGLRKEKRAETSSPFRGGKIPIIFDSGANEYSVSVIFHVVPDDSMSNNTRTRKVS